MTLKSKLLLIYTDRFSKRNIETSPLFQLLHKEFEVSVLDNSIFESRPKWHKVLSNLFVKTLQYRFSELNQFKKHLLKKKYSKVPLFNNYDKVFWFYGFPFPHSRVIFKFLLFLNKLLPSTLFLDKKFDVVFITGCQEGFAQFVLKHVDRHKIPVACLVNSWDHLTFRGPVYEYSCIKKFLVWGSVQQDELIKYHKIAADKIVKVGSPQFDYLDLVKKENTARNQIGITEDDFVVFLPAYNERHGFNEPMACEMIYNYFESLKIPFKLVLRPYPKDATFEERFKLLLNNKNVILNHISEDFEEDRRNLVLYLKHCDAVVCGPGTVAVEAMYFSKPVVFLAFECRKEFEQFSIARERFFTDHYQNIAKPEGGFFVDQIEDLLPTIAKIYHNETHFSQAKILKDQIYELDGCSGHRIYDEILKIAN